MDWVYYLTLLFVLCAGLALNLFTLPGNWLMLAAVVIYGWVTGWSYVGWVSLLVLLVLAATAEIIEVFAAGAGAKKAGGTLFGTVGALIGGVVGAIFLTGLIPIPVIGTLAGIIMGTFLGAMGGELVGGKRVSHSLAIGAGAAKGRFYGTVLKLAFGVVIMLISLIVALPLGGRHAVAAPTPTPALPPATVPTTQSATMP